MLDWVEVYMRCVPENTWMLESIKEQFKALGASRLELENVRSIAAFSSD